MMGGLLFVLSSCGGVIKQELFRPPGSCLDSESVANGYVVGAVVGS